MDLEYQERLLQSQMGGSSVGLAESPIKCKSPYHLASPSKERLGDRFIPMRTNERWALNFGSPNEKTKPCAPPPKKTKELCPDSDKDHYAYSCLLSNELLGHENADVKSQDLPLSDRKALVHINSPHASQRLFQFKNSAQIPGSENLDPTAPLYTLSPINKASQALLKSPRKAVRRICKQPCKVLDAPQLQDDFYLNLVDWSSQNLLAVGLGSCTYLWDATSSNVTKLCDLAPRDKVTSVSWADRGNHIAIGTQRALVQIWDVATRERICELPGHTARVASLAWNGDLISSGSRDRSILQRDTRCPKVVPERNLNGHKQEVCGLKWSPDKQLLASGGNDNKLFVWDLRSSSFVQQYTEHIAAVKAIAWSPHQHGLLASGGGTADRDAQLIHKIFNKICIRFWNTLTQQRLNSVDTGSQVCNLSWAKYTSELVSTHGYSQNQILIWKYPSMQQVVKLTGHTFRVLYLAMSPDGESIVTGAGDETLRFWNVFSKSRAESDSHSALNLFTQIR